MELLIVITLIVILAGISLSMHATSVRRAKEAVLKENLFRLNDSLDQYYADKERSAGPVRASPATSGRS
jgi:general secretion pathway protein G